MRHNARRLMSLVMVLAMLLSVFGFAEEGMQEIGMDEIVGIAGEAVGGEAVEGEAGSGGEAVGGAVGDDGEIVGDADPAGEVSLELGADPAGEVSLALDGDAPEGEKPHTGAAAREQPRESPVIER